MGLLWKMDRKERSSSPAQSEVAARRDLCSGAALAVGGGPGAAASARHRGVEGGSHFCTGSLCSDGRARCQGRARGAASARQAALPWSAPSGSGVFCKERVDASDGATLTTGSDASGRASTYGGSQNLPGQTGTFSIGPLPRSVCSSFYSFIHLNK